MFDFFFNLIFGLFSLDIFLYPFGALTVMAVLSLIYAFIDSDLGGDLR